MLNSNAKKTVLITGNSYAFFQIRGILDAINESKNQFKEAYFITHPACSIIAGKLNYIKGITCERYDGSFDVLLNATRPDVIIHSSRLDHFITEKVETVNILESDIYYKEFERAILNVAKYTPRLIIIEPNPILWNVSYRNPLTIAQTLRSNGSVSIFNVSIEKYHEKQDPTWNRVKKAVEHCQNCILVPTEKLFCQKTYCPAVDPQTKLGMYCDLTHLTPRYSLYLKPNIIQAIDRD
uniref:SGNH domain-containing protein n=1 Tax=Panagrolaimus sp. ES5 TaxID=591445 RepID=A0AC34G777_9BILA